VGQLAVVVLLQINVGKFKICWMCELNWSVFDWHCCKFRGLGSQFASATDVVGH